MQVVKGFQNQNRYKPTIYTKQVVRNSSMGGNYRLPVASYRSTLHMYKKLIHTLLLLVFQIVQSLQYVLKVNYNLKF